MRPRLRGLVVAGVLVALVVAGVASRYASASPDGLERVAGQVGFLDTAEKHPLSGSPLADYGIGEVADDRLSVGLAGVAGVAVTLLLAGGLGLALRRRRPPPTTAG